MLARWEQPGKELVYHLGKKVYRHFDRWGKFVHVMVVAGKMILIPDKLKEEELKADPNTLHWNFGNIILTYPL